jgi:hypothetical protein
MLASECLVGLPFAVIPVVVVLVVAIVDSKTNRLRCGVDPDRRRSNQRDGQRK